MNNRSTDEHERSLDSFFHDATITHLESDRFARTVTLVVEYEEIREFAGLPEGFTWRFVLEGVNCAQARGGESWTGPKPELKGLSRQEQEAVVGEYQAKGRTVSVSWDLFETIVNDKELWVYWATLRQASGRIVLEGGGSHEEPFTHYSFSLEGERLRCERSDGVPVTIDEVLDLADACWAS